MDITLGFTGWLHTLSCLYALATGGAVLWRVKGNASHRMLGQHYLIAACLANVSALFLHRLGGFTVFHTLALVALACLAGAFVTARWQWPRRGWLRIHLTTMLVSCYLMAGGLVNELFARLPSLRGEYGLRAFSHSGVMLAFMMMIAYYWGRTAKPLRAPHAQKVTP